MIKEGRATAYTPHTMIASLRRTLVLPLLAAAAFAAMIVGFPATAQVPPHGTEVVDTRHSVTIHGKRMAYTAHTGLLPLYVDQTGELMGNIFIIAYIADRPAGAPPRPITFLWNGGPGSDSAQVHVVGFGPKRVTTPDTFMQWGENTETPLIDHEESWFDTSDLVFIDPPGTGFSRATTNAYRDILYTGRGDAEAVAEAIRVFLTRYDMWNRPLFIAGESYGTNRAMLVSEALEKRRTRLNGVVLISGNYEAGQAVPIPLQEALALPILTLSSHYHRRLPPDLQALSGEDAAKQAEAWARATYAPALAKAGALGDAERQAILAGLQRYTGLDRKFIDPKSLIIAPDVYGDKLLADQGLEIGRYDSRMVYKARAEGVDWMPWDDPSLKPMADLMEGVSRVFNAYIRKDLGFKSDLLYRGPFGKAFYPEPLTTDPNGYPADWMASMFKVDRTPPGEIPPLRRAMDMNPKLLVMNLRGNFDITGSCELTDEAVAESAPSIRARVTNHCVTGGHMFYSDLASRRQVQGYFADFVKRALAH